MTVKQSSGCRPVIADRCPRSLPFGGGSGVIPAQSRPRRGGGPGRRRRGGDEANRGTCGDRTSGRPGPDPGAAAIVPAAVIVAAMAVSAMIVASSDSRHAATGSPHNGAAAVSASDPHASPIPRADCVLGASAKAASVVRSTDTTGRACAGLSGAKNRGERNHRDGKFEVVAHDFTLHRSSNRKSKEGRQS